MTELQQIAALLKTIDARLARIERLLQERPVFVGIPPGLRVVPFEGKVS